MSFSDPWAGNQAGYQAALDKVNAQAGVITNVVDGVPYDANGQPVNTNGSAFYTPGTNQLNTANGSQVDMSAYGATPEKPADWQGDYWSWINHLSDIGAINYDANNQGGLINTIQNNGWLVPLALAGGVAAGGGLAGAFGAEAAGGAGALDSTAAALGGSGGGGAFVPTAGSSFALPSVGAISPTVTSGADSILSSPNVQVPSLGAGMPSGASGIDFASTGGAGGLNPAIPANTMVGNGTLGTTIGQTYMAAAPGQFAVDASGAAIPASSVGIGGYAPTSTSLADILKNAPSPKQVASAAQGLASLLSPASVLSGAASKLAAGSTPAGTATTALSHGNLNPFVQEQNFQVSAPKNLASLLRQG